MNPKGISKGYKSSRILRVVVLCTLGDAVPGEKERREAEK